MDNIAEEVKANTNANSPAESVTIPVTELAAKLSVPLPRLQRALKREQFASHVSKADRKTRTGTRTVTVVNISVLPALEAALREGEGEQKREHSRPEVLTSDEPNLRAMLDFVTRQADARIGEQARTIEDLRKDKDELRGELERERLRAEALAFEVLQLKALPSAQVVAAGDAPPSLQNGDSTGDEAQVPMETPSNSPQRQNRRFWQRLWSRSK